MGQTVVPPAISKDWKPSMSPCPPLKSEGHKGLWLGILVILVIWIIYLGLKG